MIQLCSLSSGSNGNAFLIRTGSNGFLVDAGISCKQICLRLQQVGSHIDEIDAVFITHEHSDHIRGLDVLMRRFPRPVYVTKKTYWNSSLTVDESLLRFIGADDSVTIGDTEIQSLSKSHDAADPALFCFYHGERKISVITDAGYACANVTAAIKGSHAVFLESNYDEVMLRDGFYPPFLKKRVAGKRGHLSNVMAGELIRDHASPALEYVFLSHLSENNNTPELAFQTFCSTVEARGDLQKLQTQTLLTSRYEVSTVVKLT
jgi:phosphoribosyl 1,2-cyclic phosphodiesterase